MPRTAANYVGKEKGWQWNETTAMSAVEKMYDCCFNRGDLETIKNEVFAPDLKWTLPGRHPLGGAKHGADEVLAFFGEAQPARRPGRPDQHRAWTEDTVVEVHRGYGHRGRREARRPQLTHYIVRDGKIAEVQVYGRPVRRGQLLLGRSEAQADPRPAHVVEGTR